MALHVEPVRSGAQRKEFIYLPRKLYRNSPWVPPLWMEERNGYGRRKNAVLADNEYELLIARRSGKAVGRILVYIDSAWNEHFQCRDGLFGALDAEDSADTFSALIQAARLWLEKRGMNRLTGPIHPVAEFWGVLVQGFDQSPMFLTPWNPAYTDGHIRASGMDKEIDLYAYEADSGNGYRLNPRYYRFYDRFLKRNPEYRIRRFDPSRLLEEAEHIWRLTNQALIHNWGFVPVPRAIFLDMVGRMKLIIDPDAIWFVEHRGKVVAYAFGHPDLNIILKKIRGRLFPTGWFHLWRKRLRLRHYRLFGLGVDEEYQGLGLDALMYVHLYKQLSARDIRLEANWILENNTKMNNSLIRLGMKRTKEYRMYSSAV